MIEVYRTSEPSPLAAEVEAALADLVLSHRIRIVTDRDDAPAWPLPVVAEGERVVTADELPAYLAELRRFAADWRRFQSDACYVGEDGEVC